MVGSRDHQLPKYRMRTNIGEELNLANYHAIAKFKSCQYLFLYGRYTDFKIFAFYPRFHWFHIRFHQQIFLF